MLKKPKCQLSEYVILGLGDANNRLAHALKTAEAINAIEPDFVRLRPLVPKINTLLLHQINKGRFQLLTPHQVLEETRLLIEKVTLSTTLTSDHYTNYLNLSGNLPEEKDKLIEAVKQALTWDSSQFRPNLYRDSIKFLTNCN